MYTYWGEDSCLLSTQQALFHANTQHKHYTIHIGMDICMKFVCDDSFVPGILKETNISVSPTK